MSLTSLRIFVKRGALWRFNRLRRDAQKLPISVEWDRRKEDRRGCAPFTWDIAEFVVVDDHDGRA